MSILDTNPTEAGTESANMAADRLITMTRQAYKIMVNAFNEGANIFWDNPNQIDPKDIAQSLGNNAKEVFELHYALGQLIYQVKPQAIEAGLSKIGQFTMNEDGTVTIIDPPPPTEP